MLKYCIVIILIYYATIQVNCASCGDKEWDNFTKNRSKYIANLSETVYACVRRDDTRYTVFHGCVDWHSSVHGYWALLRASKYIDSVQKDKYLNIITKSFSSQGINDERLFLKEHKGFEMPYGRAWFLRLAIEYEQKSKLKTLRQMADEVALSLIEYYTSHKPVPNLAEYENAEWAFRNLHDYALFTNNKMMINYVSTQARSFMDYGCPSSIGNDRTDDEFFSRWGNYFHVLETLADSRSFNAILNKCGSTNDLMAPITTFGSDHHLGVNYSRAWGLWSVYKKTHNKVYRDAYLDNVMANYSLHEKNKYNYHSYGHWVPQFGIYAITYPLEEDIY
jgi:hypothetical protein